ncbi:MAG: hypothetical protein IH946_05750 [Bacteroidetes bacterium]|nr:hypothetical protein [Bacteroidota bacterium]
MHITKATVIYIIVLCLPWFSCAPLAESPNEYEGDWIILGNGGGVAGLEQTITILENGQVFHWEVIGYSEEPPPHTEMSRFKKKKVGKFFEKAASIDFMNIKYSQPGNLYFFVEIRLGTQTNRVTWGIPEKNFDKLSMVKNFYEEVIVQVK